MKRNTITGFLHGTQTFIIDSSLIFHQLLNLVAEATDSSVSKPSDKQQNESYRYNGNVGEDSFRIEKTKTPFYQHPLVIDGQLKDSKLGYELHMTFSMKNYSFVVFFALMLIVNLLYLFIDFPIDGEFLWTNLTWLIIVTILNWHDVWRQGKKEMDFLHKQIEKLENAPMLEGHTDIDTSFVSQNAPQTQEVLGKR